MRYAAVTLAVAALASQVCGVALKCIANLDPYCCAAAASEPTLGVEVGVQCEKKPYGHKMKCPQTDIKICCSKDAIDLLGLHLVLLCQLPDGLLGELGPILGGPAPI